jgi:hypothetical protein
MAFTTNINHSRTNGLADTRQLLVKYDGQTRHQTNRIREEADFRIAVVGKSAW